MSADWVKSAKVGDKVVCVDIGFYTIHEGCGGPDSDPVYGDICTISGFHEHHDGDIYLFLVEQGGHQAFHWNSFRPANHRDANFRVFTDMLKTVNKPVKETV